jgi:hypothetical protein
VIVEQKIVFVPDRPFHSSLIFASKAGVYLSGANVILMNGRVLGLVYKNKNEFKTNAKYRRSSFFFSSFNEEYKSFMTQTQGYLLH